MIEQPDYSPLDAEDTKLDMELNAAFKIEPEVSRELYARFQPKAAQEEIEKGYSTLVPPATQKIEETMKKFLSAAEDVASRIEYASTDPEADKRNQAASAADLVMRFAKDSAKVEDEITKAIKSQNFELARQLLTRARLNTPSPERNRLGADVPHSDMDRWARLTTRLEDESGITALRKHHRHLEYRAAQLLARKMFLQEKGRDWSTLPRSPDTGMVMEQYFDRAFVKLRKGRR